LNEVQGHEARQQEPFGIQEIAQQQGPKNKRARNQSQPTIQIHVLTSKNNLPIACEERNRLSPMLFT
jgi:hypothetical protein